MSLKTILGSYNVQPSGSPPYVVMKLNNNLNSVINSVYNQYLIQQSAGFVCSFQIYASGSGDGLIFFVGASDAVGQELCVSCAKGGVAVSFNIYPGWSSGSYSGAGIYLMNGAGTLVASAPFSANSAWESVTITYNRGVTNTWVVSWKGNVVITYSDPTNPRWVPYAGNYWGIGAFSGGAGAIFKIQQVSLSAVPTPLPGI